MRKKGEGHPGWDDSRRVACRARIAANSTKSTVQGSTPVQANPELPGLSPVQGSTPVQANPELPELSPVQGPPPVQANP